MKISIHFSGIEKGIEFDASLNRKIEQIVSAENKKLGEISIIFTSNVEILELNKRFLDHHYFTDIITFNSSKRNTLNGELFISLDQVKINAKHLNIPFYNEVLRVIIHGILHLIGYNDITEDEKHVMRKKEDVYLCLFTNKGSIKESDSAL